MRALTAFPAASRLGLTATPTRRDGLGRAIEWLLGPLAVDIKRKAGDVLVRWHDGARNVEPVRDGKSGEMLYAATISRLLACDARNRALMHCIRDGVRRGRQIIVIGERRTHLETLQGEFDGSALYLGETSKRKKKERDANAQTANPLFASYSMGEEALDIPRLDMLVFASPRGSPACIEQCVGRVLRAHEGKPVPEVHDFVDSVFVSMAAERRRFYKAQGWRVYASG